MVLFSVAVSSSVLGGRSNPSRLMAGLTNSTCSCCPIRTTLSSALPWTWLFALWAKVRELPAIEISNKAQMRLFLEELITECLL